jgi:hypothetical protein
MPTAPETPVKIKNTAKTAAIIWWILCVLFLAGIFTPWYFESAGVETGNWVFAVMVFCFVLGITSFFVGIMYTKRARLVSRMLRGENLLAHWTYSPEEWARYAQKEYNVNKREKRNLFLLVTAIAVVIGIIFTALNPDDWLLFLCIVLGVIIIAGGSAFIAVETIYQQNRKHLGEAYFTPYAVFLNRELHTWKGFGAALDDVTYNKTGHAMPVIEIEYSTPNRYNRQSFTVRVPVPPDREEEALKVLETLRGQIKNT